MRLSRKMVEQRLECAIAEYERVAKKEYDPRDGWAQVPITDEQARAYIRYGEITALESILDS